VVEVKESVSALMDGELEGQAADGTLAALRGDGESLQASRR
jgi:negative regulator of sigma E activity